MINYFTPILLAIVNKTIKILGKKVEKLGLSPIAGENLSGTSAVVTSQFLKMLWSKCMIQKFFIGHSSILYNRQKVETTQISIN